MVDRIWYGTLRVTSILMFDRLLLHGEIGPTVLRVSHHSRLAHEPDCTARGRAVVNDGDSKRRATELPVSIR